MSPSIQAPEKITKKQVLRNRKKWENALLGNGPKKYRQHRNALASDTYRSFCCMGVAAESVKDLKLVRSDCQDYRTEDDGLLVTGTLNASQVAKLGISGGMQDLLVQLNDAYHAPLKVIGAVLHLMPVVNPKDGYPFAGNRQFWPGHEFDKTLFLKDPEVKKLLADYQKEYNDND